MTELSTPPSNEERIEDPTITHPNNNPPDQPNPKFKSPSSTPSTPLHLASEKPPFTLKEIRDSIPAHCFDRSAVTALIFTIQNIGICLSLLYIAIYWIPSTPWPIQLVLWPLYWFLQGSYMFGLWILGHECGHEAFSEHSLLNHSVGLVLHSFLLVPYHSWRLSHKKHHLNTGSAEHDQVFVPRPRSYQHPRYITKILELRRQSAIFDLFLMITMQILGFLPLYLVFNFTGPSKYVGKEANHFSPSAAIFSPKDKGQILLSNIVYAVWIAILLFWSYQFGVGTIICLYGVPQMLTNYFLAIVTFLQHTDVFVPHFKGEEWSWLRGALCTVDRSFGPWLDSVFHHISDTHVVHHLFPQLPFYHAKEATGAVEKVLGGWRMKDDTPILKALWRAHRNCLFVEDKGNVLFYKNE